MKKLILTVTLFLSLTATYAEEEPIMMTGDYEISDRTRKLSKKFQRDVESGGLRYKIDRSLDAIIKLAAYKLKRIGKKKEANQLLKEWHDQHEYSLIFMRGIGSHAPLSQWLSDKYLQWEFILGKDILHALRLSDIHTLNHAIPVVVSCIDDVDLHEYSLHFVYDDENGYRGLGPVVTYWTTFIVCVGGTWGSGFLFCAPIAMGTEFLSKQFVCPKLTEPLWKWACKKEEY